MYSPKFVSCLSLMSPFFPQQVNINKRKKDAFQILHPELEEDPVGNPFFDERVALDKKKLVRPRRPTFQFVEEGKWSKEAEMQKLRVSSISLPCSCVTSSAPHFYGVDEPVLLNHRVHLSRRHNMAKQKLKR